MLYIVVPVHNRAPITARFLDALVKQTSHDYKLILVNDGCVDNTVAVAERALPSDRLVVLTGDGTLWWAGALQMAYEYLCGQRLSHHDAVLLINDDVTFPPDFLARGLGVLCTHPHACIQALGVDVASGSVDRGVIADTLRLRFRAAQLGESVNCLSTRGLLMSAKTFSHSGGFRPRWLPHYLSDYEFTLRLHRRGTTLLVDERFAAQVDLELTGLSQPTPASAARRLWAESFSNRAKFNPKHWTAFAMLVCPPWVAGWHVVRIWLGFARSVLFAAWPLMRKVNRA